jgi:hypothetical protein
MVQTADSVTELEQEIRAIDQPIVTAVANWDVRLDEDWSGDPAVYVMVTFKDSEIRAVWHARNALRAEIERRAARLFPDRISYVRFSAESIAMDPDPSPSRSRRARR